MLNRGQISARVLVLLAMFSYLFALGVNVARAECFDYTIKIPSTEFGADFVGEAPVSWCSEVDSETGELKRQLSFSSCTGSGPGYVSCSTHPHDSNDTSFAVLAEWVFCPLAPGGGCLWVVFDSDVQFSASGNVTTLSENLRTARSGPPNL
jgi:hypothetical protein